MTEMCAEKCVSNRTINLWPEQKEEDGERSAAAALSVYPFISESRSNQTTQFTKIEAKAC